MYLIKSAMSVPKLILAVACVCDNQMYQLALACTEPK